MNSTSRFWSELSTRNSGALPSLSAENVNAHLRLTTPYRLASLVLVSLAIGGCSPAPAPAVYKSSSLAEGENSHANLVFRSTNTVPKDLSSAEFHGLIINGRVVTRQEYPALFLADVKHRPDCTGILVGPQALLTAAHCVNAGPTQVSIETADSKQHSGECERADEYDQGRADIDVALCFFASPIRIVEYESVSTEHENLKIGQTVQLSGFGCNSRQSEGFNVLRIGEARVSALPTTSSALVVTEGTVLLCDQDSGGPMYSIVPSAGRFPIRDAVIGVNSTVYFNPDNSYITSLGSPPVVKFLQTWSGKHQNAQICGLPGSVSGCRVRGE